LEEAEEDEAELETEPEDCGIKESDEDEEDDEEDLLLLLVLLLSELLSETVVILSFCRATDSTGIEGATVVVGVLLPDREDEREWKAASRRAESWATADFRVFSVVLSFAIFSFSRLTLRENKTQGGVRPNKYIHR
jgi:hypothetical protein